MSQQEVREELNRIVCDSYTVFAPYSIEKRISLQVCKCSVCMSDEVERLLLLTPLQEIPLGLISELENSADGGGDLQETKYFLPRQFELLATGEATSLIGIECSLKRLSEWDWRSWEEAEVLIIEKYLQTLIRASLYRSDPCSFEECFESYLVLLSRVSIDAAAVITETMERGIKEEIATICDLRFTLCGKRFSNGFWSKKDAEAAQAAFFSDRVLQKFLELLDSPHESEFDSEIEEGMNFFW